jgi:hypothetical protein
MSTQGKGTYLINSSWASGSLVFYEKAVGRTATGDIFTIGTAAVKVGGTAQDVDFQFYATGSKSAIIDAGAGTFTLTGVSLVQTAALSVTIAALTAGDAYSGIRSIVTAAAPSNSYGIAGYFESDLTGTVAGTVYGFGSWVNLDADVKCGSNWIYAQDNGIYGPASIGSDMSSACFVIGMRMEFVIDDGQNPSELYLFSTNIYSNALTAMFSINAAEDFGWITSTATTTTTGHFPIIKCRSSGVVYYVNVYTGG